MGHIVPVILCGGSGTRLWPLSRGQHPKQFLKLLGEHSSFQETVLRARTLESAVPPLIIGNEDYRFLVLDELTELGVNGATLLLEPVGRNTAPALAVAALYLKRTRPDALLLALPADHHVEDVEAFSAALQKGVGATEHSSVVVFGVPPTQPHTGYGYIHKGRTLSGSGVHQVRQFKEKPDAQTARAYLASGEYLWNSGIFLVRADVYLQELSRQAPDIARSASESIQGMKPDGVFLRLNREAFISCRNESIDYAVMEHTQAGMVVELDAGWSDLGSWSSLREVGSRAADNNVTHGDVMLTDVTGSFVHSSGRLITAVGLRDQVVVETPDAVLVAPLERAEEVKQLVVALKEKGRDEVETHLRVYRPWGWYESLARSERMLVKRIRVKPGASLSLQLHHHRAEHWVVVNGEAEVTRGEGVFRLREDESTYIPANTKHRLRNNGDKPLVIIEVQTGSYLGEDDIVRFVDNYGRVTN